MKLLLLGLCVAYTFAGLPQNWPDHYELYKGYKVLEVEPANEDQALLLRQWMMSDNELDFWQEPSRIEPAHIMVSPVKMSQFSVQLRKHGFKWSVYQDNVHEQVKQFLEDHAKRMSRSKKVFDLNDFNTFDDIIDWVENTVPGMCADGLSCTTAEEGLTHEGRRIVSLSMSTGSGRQTFLMNSLIHAREWLTGATVSNIINHMANNYGSDDRVTYLLDNYDFLIIPVLNPDGYEYSWTNERLWRKNRNPYESCVGVDLNRNYDYNWGEEGVSHLPCSDLYCGPFGNSELESQTLDAIMARLVAGSGVIGYLDVHSYGYMWMHPWGNTINFAGSVCERADDHDDMYWVADRAADAIEATHGTNWARGTSCEVIYATTGATDDYAKGVHGVKYPICPELRGNGFIVPPEEIQPSFEEIWNGIHEMITSIEIREGL